MQPAAAPARGIESLASFVRGQVIRPEDPTYETARRIHNGMIDRRPSAIVRCTGAADVMQCVRFARDTGIATAVRGGGHSVPGFSVCDGGLLIDLSAARSVRVDRARQTARADGGATWGDFDHETGAYGLGSTGGVMRTTGIGGLTLAGGHGLLMRKFGLACDNLLSADVVTADGTVLTASAEENADLFWGLRGGGGNFGVVTSFEYRLRPVSVVLGGLLLYPMERAKETLEFYDGFAASAPEELGLIAFLGTLPDGTKAAGMLLAYNGPIEEGEKALKPLRSLGPFVDQVAPMPYTAVQSIAENFNPRGLRNYWKTSYLAEMKSDAIDAMIERHMRAPSPFTHQILYTFGGAVARIPDGDTAVSYRNARHAFIAIGVWEDAARDAENIAYVRELWSAVQPFSFGGFYPNYDGDAAAGEVKKAYGAAKYERLLAVKRKYDPHNFFRLNQNIDPA
jgi:FAD/FMN-containing dehydrogenase